MPKKPDTSNFIDVVESGTPKVEDYESVFRDRTAGPPGVRRVTSDDPANPYGIDISVIDYTFHHRVFLIWRPWNKCSRCKDALDRGSLQLPETGDHVCPHTHLEEYRRVTQAMLDGGQLRQSIQESTLVDGSIQISLAWLVPKVDRKKVKELMARQASNTSEGSPT
jgi:hypothetical protein